MMNRAMNMEELKLRLHEVDEDTQIALICTLYQRCEDARQVIDAKLLGSDYPKRLFEDSCKQLYACFFPDDEIRGFSLNHAKAIVADFQKQCDDRRMKAELQLYFAQCAVQLDRLAGDLYERFYAVTARMYEEAANVARTDRQLFQCLRPQFQQVMEEGKSIGWGLGAFMRDTYRSLLKTAEGSNQQPLNKQSDKEYAQTV